MPHFLNAGSLSQPGKQASGRNIAKVGFASAHEGAARPSVATRSGGKSQIAFVSSNKLKLRKERELESPLAGTLEPGVRVVIIDRYDLASGVHRVRVALEGKPKAPLGWASLDKLKKAGEPEKKLPNAELTA